MQIARALLPVVDFVFPPRCPLCGTGLGAQSGLCAACWGELAIPGDPSCVLCARPFRDSESVPGGEPQGAVCAPCLAEPPVHDGIAAATLYNDASRKLVLAFKHGNRIALAELMGRLIAARLPQIGAEWVLVPVPLHRWRLWRRGYNQAALLARSVSRVTGAVPVVDALERRKRTATLGGLGRKARRRELRGAIAIAPPRAGAIKGRRIVLIDDVLTSGATTDACVRVLKRAGAKEVVVACFARVIDDV